MGDAELAAQRRWKSAGLLAPTAVLKVGHHGSDNGTAQETLDALYPCLAVVSVGGRNSFGHPGVRAVNLLRMIGAEILRTDYEGDIIISLRSTGQVTAWTGRGGAEPVARCARGGLHDTAG
jgi:competence protein ComEC